MSGITQYRPLAARVLQRKDELEDALADLSKHDGIERMAIETALATIYQLMTGDIAHPSDVVAHDLVVMGSLHGNVTCGDLLDVRFESSLAGDITARRVRIDEGAMLKGHVEVHAENVKSESDEIPGQDDLVH